MKIIKDLGEINTEIHAVITDNEQSPYSIVKTEQDQTSRVLISTSDIVVFAKAITDYSAGMGYARLLDISRKSIKQYLEYHDTDEELLEDVLDLSTDERETLGAVKFLDDYYNWEYGFKDGEIIIGDKIHLTYEMTLSPEVNDNACCRVLINGEYYYFGA